MYLLDRLFRRKIIIGIHGLDNKPPPALLAGWWRKAISEGFVQMGFPEAPVHFELAYWADVLHEKPLDPTISDPKDPRYLNDPYVPGHPGVYLKDKKTETRKKILKVLEEKLFDLAYDGPGVGLANAIANKLIHVRLGDMEAYMRGAPPIQPHDSRSAAEAIRDRLASLIRKHRGKQILILSHSMGTLVAYDTLTRDVPDIPIHTYVTMGSPLGLPPIMRQACRRQGLDFRKDCKLSGPENVTHHWYNFSDLEDPVATNFDLADDYAANTRGIGPEDIQIRNNYEFNGHRDPHTIYGYLRAPEVMRVVRGFLKG